jgi:hypothetical protein
MDGWIRTWRPAAVILQWRTGPVQIQLGGSVYEETNIAAEQGDGAETVQNAAGRQIFRIEAYENYVQNKERVVMPRLASSKGFAALWAIAGLLMASGLVMAFWPLLRQYLIGSP